MISFHQSVETLFTGIFGCGKSFDNADFSDLVECKENQNDVTSHSNEREECCDAKRMIHSEENRSFLNDTNTTCHNSFFSESCSSYSDSNRTGRRSGRIPLRPRQEPPQVRLHDRELMVVPPDGTMKNWSPLMPLPVLVAKKEKQQAQLPISPMLPPKIQRLTLDDAPAFPRYPRHHHYNDRTKTTPTNIATPQGVLYDIDGLPMDVPEPFSRSRSLDFLFSFPSPSFSKETKGHEDLYRVEESRHHQREPCHVYFEPNSHYQKRGMVEDTSTYLYPFKNRKRTEKGSSQILTTHTCNYEKSKKCTIKT